MHHIRDSVRQTNRVKSPVVSPRSQPYAAVAATSIGIRGHSIASASALRPIGLSRVSSFASQHAASVSSTAKRHRVSRRIRQTHRSKGPACARVGVGIGIGIGIAGLIDGGHAERIAGVHTASFSLEQTESSLVDQTRQIGQSHPAVSHDLEQYLHARAGYADSAVECLLSLQASSTRHVVAL